MPALKQQRPVLTRRNYDNMDANASNYERNRKMREQVKALKRKSPNVDRMYSVSIPSLKITYYFQTAEKRKIKTLELEVLHPNRELIIKSPTK